MNGDRRVRRAAAQGPIVEALGPGFDDLRQCLRVGADRGVNADGAERSAEIERQSPGLRVGRGTAETDHRLGPVQAWQQGLLRRAAEDHVAGTGAAAANTQVDAERLVIADRQDFLRRRQHIEVAAERGAVEPGELVRERIHARVEAGALAVDRIEVRGLAVAHDGVAIGIHGNAVDRAVGLRVVGFFRQAERIVEEALGAGQRAADNRQRAADRVDALLEGREHQRVAAVDNLVIDRHHGHGLRRGPVVAGVEHHLRHHRGAHRRAQAQGRRAAADSGDADQHAGIDVLERDGISGGVGDGDDAAAHRHIIGGDVEQFAERGGDVGQAVAVFGGVVGGDAAKRRFGVAAHVTQLQAPDLAGGDLTLEFDRRRDETGRRGGAVAARDADLGGTIGRLAHREPAAGVGVDPQRHLGIERIGRGDQELRRLRADRHAVDDADIDAADLHLRAERRSILGPQDQQDAAVGGRGVDRGIGVGQPDDGRLVVDRLGDAGGDRTDVVAGQRGVIEGRGGYAGGQGEAPDTTVGRRFPGFRQIDRQARGHHRGIAAVAVDRRLQAGRHGGEIAATVIEKDFAFGRLQCRHIAAEAAVGQALEHRVDERINAERGVEAGQGDDPIVARRRRAAQLDQGTVGGDPHLAGGVFAKRRIRVERLGRVVGAGGGRQHVDHHRTARLRLRRQHHAEAVGDQRRHRTGRGGDQPAQALVVGTTGGRAGAGRGQRAGIHRQQGTDLVAAVQSRRHGPGSEAGAVEHEGLGLGVIAGDARGLAGAGALDDGQDLAGDVECACIERMARHRDDEVVLHAAGDSLQVRLAVEIVVGDDRRHAHGVLFGGAPCGDVVFDEGVVRGFAAGVDDGIGGAVLGERDQRSQVAAGIDLEQLKLRADGVVDRLESWHQRVDRALLELRDDAQEAAEPDEHRLVVRHHAVESGEGLERTLDQAGVVDVDHQVGAAAAHRGVDDRIDVVGGAEVRIEDADRGARRHRIESAAGTDQFRQFIGDRQQVAIPQCGALVALVADAVAQGETVSRAVDGDGEGLANRHRRIGEVRQVDHHLGEVLAQVFARHLGRRQQSGVIRPHTLPLQVADDGDIAAALRLDDDGAVGGDVAVDQGQGGAQPRLEAAAGIQLGDQEVENGLGAETRIEGLVDDAA